MAIDAFSVQNVGGIKLASCSNVPQLMVIAGPNGVGKSTLLEYINNHISDPQNNVELDGDTNNVYFSPHRAPSPNSITTTALSGLSNQSSRHLLGGDNYNLSSNTNSDIPSDFRHGYKRNRNKADYAPYFEVEKRLAQFEYQKGNILTEVYEEQGEVPAGYVPDLNCS